MNEQRPSKELLPRLRDGSAACLRSMARHTGEIQEMFHVLALLMTDAGDEIERLRAKKCDCNNGACSKCSTAPITKIVGEPASAQDTSNGGSARAVTEQASRHCRDALFNEWQQSPSLGYEHWLETEVLRLRASSPPAESRWDVNYQPALVFAVRELLGSLPKSRDWFNPDAERVFREYLSDARQRLDVTAVTKEESR